MIVTAAVWHQLGSFTGMEPWGEDNDIVVKLVASSASSKPHSTLASSSGPRQRVAPQRAKDVPSCPKGCACTSCRWPSEGASLEREFRLSDGVDPSVIMGLSGAQAILAKGSWCQTKQGPDGKLRLGCIACAALPSDRTATSKVRLWATSQACSKTLTRWRMRRHANSQVHKAAVLHLLGVEVGPTGGCVAGAPPLDEFQALLAHMGEGESERASARRQTNSKCSTKVRRMRWVLVEALREQDRKFLAGATTIVLCRDERESRLLLRYSACSSNLQVRRGFLGQTRNAGGHACELVNATRKAIRQFCTKKWAMPAGGRGKAVHDKALQRHIQDHVEIVVSDSAPNEVMAANIGRGWRQEPIGNAEALTPNLVLIGRDCAHGFRRTAFLYHNLFQ